MSGHYKFILQFNRNHTNWVSKVQVRRVYALFAFSNVSVSTNEFVGVEILLIDQECCCWIYMELSQDVLNPSHVPLSKNFSKVASSFYMDARLYVKFLGESSLLVCNFEILEVLKKSNWCTMLDSPTNHMIC